MKVKHSYIPETYKKISKQDPIKVEINKRVAQEFQKRNRGNKFFIVLDSAEQLTLKTLRKYGVTRVEVPNPTPAYDTIKKTHRQTHKLFLSEYLDLINAGCEGQVAGIWLDYCCGVDGNKDVSPKDDIKKIFRNDILSSDSVLAFTFCFRNAKGVDFKYQDLYEIEALIQEEAYNTGFCAIRIPFGVHYKGMFFGMFQLHSYD
jgi:hypothetical protein